MNGLTYDIRSINVVMDLPSMHEDGKPETIKLVRIICVYKVEQSTDIIKTINLVRVQGNIIKMI